MPVACNEAGLIRREKERRRRDLVRPAHTASGVALTNCAFPASVASFEPNKPSRIGVSVVPGLRTFERMPRSFN
jgi:hypothetical protein